MRSYLQAALLAAVVIGFFVVYPEYRARGDASNACAGIELGSKMAVDAAALTWKRAELKPAFGSLYTINFVADDEKQANGTGGVLMVFLGGFPFGREFCALKLKDNTVIGKRTVLGADDYAYCKGDVRLVTECG